METQDDAREWKDNWIQLRKLRGGGQASAHHGQSKIDGSSAFLKILNQQNDCERRARFHREATAYETCRYPGIPKLSQSNTHKHADLEFKLYLATEFVEGPTLTERINQGCLSLTEAVEVLHSLLQIASYFHGQGWVHRDIKPDNIILGMGFYRRL